MKQLSILLFTVLVLTSCEEKPVPMLDIVVPPGNKTVLVEDFTGVSCPNCPEGARIVENLKTIYGKDRIISVAVHSDGFDQLHADSKYQFKTEDGQEMQDAIDVLFSKPAASINRTISPFSGDGGSRFYQTKEQWPDGVAQEISKPSEVNIGMELDYNNQTRELQINITFVPVIDINRPLNLTVLIAESGLVDPQSDQHEVVEDYVHDHVLRDIITSPLGEDVGSSFSRGVVYDESYTYTIPEDTSLPWWNADNCEIIAFVHEPTTSESKRVLQTISKKVVE